MFCCAGAGRRHQSYAHLRTSFTTTTTRLLSSTLRPSHEYLGSSVRFGPVSSRLVIRNFGNLLLSRGSVNIPPTFHRPTPLLRKSQHTRSFSSTPIAMTATKIDGTAIAKSIREKLHAQIEETQKTNPRFQPSLKIIQGTITLPIVLVMC